MTAARSNQYARNSISVSNSETLLHSASYELHADQFCPLDRRSGISIAVSLAALPRRISASIHILRVCNYGLHHYDNHAGSENWCWGNAIFRDEAIFQVCTANKYLQIGQPEESNYDRICLDLNRLKSGDCPVVQLDHEAILLKTKIKIVRELAPSYTKLVAKVLGAYFQCNPRQTPGN